MGKPFDVKVQGKKPITVQELLDKGIERRFAYLLFRTFNFRAIETDFSEWATKVVYGEIDLTQYREVGKNRGERLKKVLQEAGYQSNKNDIIRMEEYRPHLVIPTDKAHHVYPVAYFESIIKGEAVEPIPEDVLRVIITEWLRDTRGA